MKQNDPTNRRPGRVSLRRARSLTLIQELLFVGTAFVLGGVLQMLVILHIGGILE
jgi:4-hydroxybenzoate polyprenyltransferase